MLITCNQLPVTLFQTNTNEYGWVSGRCRRSSPAGLTLTLTLINPTRGWTSTTVPSFATRENLKCSVQISSKNQNKPATKVLGNEWTLVMNNSWFCGRVYRKEKKHIREKRLNIFMPQCLQKEQRIPMWRNVTSHNDADHSTKRKTWGNWEANLAMGSG